MFVLFLVVGLFVCFLGLKLFGVVLFLSGVLLTVAIVWLIFYSTFLNDNTKAWVGWVVLGCSALLGCLTGFFFLKLAKLGAFCIGAWGGFTLGLLIYNSFLYFAHSQWALWGTAVGLAVLCGVASLFLYDHVLILSTSLAGSFMVIYAIGLVAGRYTNPFTIYEQIE